MLSKYGITAPFAPCCQWSFKGNSNQAVSPDYRLTITRPDIVHSMSALSQKTHYCSERDYEEARHVLAYIMKHPGKPLIFHTAPARDQPASLRGVLDMPMFIMGSADSAHQSAGCSEVPRDQIATFIRIGSPFNAVIHVSSKVSGPTLSACEAENSAAVAATKELLDIYFTLNWLGFRNISLRVYVKVTILLTSHCVLPLLPVQVRDRDTLLAMLTG